jgi:2-polyprenyl-3-methyl-5-hydroxy-6-metoxy-1,4-benzoquinol methylase
MQNDYAKKYRTLYENHWWWRAREKAILREIDQLGFVPDGSQTLLDVGCGDGLLFDALSPFGKIFGVEADSTTLSEDGKWREQIFCQQFDQSFQPQEQFDLILMLDLLEHLPFPQDALEHAKSLLSPNGKILMTVPAFQALWTNHDDLNHHFIRYDKNNFASLVSNVGIHIDQLRYLFHWTCPVKLAIRAKEALVKSTPIPPETPNRVVNAICYGLTRLEQFTISRLGMPFGSSLLAVGSPARESN